MVYQHYRTLLDSRCQEVYDALYHGIKKVETKIITPLVTQIELNKIYEFLVLDNPIFFYFKERSYTWTQKEIIFTPIYLYDIDTICNYLKEIGRLTRVLRFKNGRNDYDFILHINGLLKRKVVYNDDGSDESHSIIGSLINKSAVCDGISKLFKYICDINDIYCIVSIGRAKSTYNSETYTGHAWNKVKIDNTWVNIDITYNLTAGSDERHDYCFLSDKALKQTHIGTSFDMINCESDEYNYYYKNNLVMENQNSLRSFLNKIITNNQDRFEFKIPKTKNIEEVINKVVRVTEDVLAEKNIYKGFRVEYNLDQLIFFIYLD